MNDSDELVTALKRLLKWAEQRKSAEVDARPDVNIHKRTLAETWDQVIRKLKLELTSLGVRC